MRTQATFILILLFAAPSFASSLEQKAAYFRRDLYVHHLSPEGVVIYRVKSDGTDKNARYPNLADTPTFTGQFAAAACTRATDANGESKHEALKDAALAMRGLAFLMDVTGEPGLMARAVRRGSAENERGRWFSGAAGFENYVWRGDVSVDQYANGLLPALHACRPHFPSEVRRLLFSFITHLEEHDLHLVDPDGRPTRFGDLSWKSAGGFNSVFQLTAYAAYALAAAMDVDPRWRETLDRMRDRYQIPARSRRTNIRIGALTNYSNDLMSWNLYRVLVPLARELNDPALADLRHGLYRAALRGEPDRNPFFQLIFCRLEPADCEPSMLENARSLLERFPREKRTITPNPEALAALPLRWMRGRKWRRQARNTVPMELRSPSSFEWKSSPYRVRVGNHPSTKYSGLDYLVAYWLFLHSSAGDPGPK